MCWSCRDYFYLYLFFTSTFFNSTLLLYIYQVISLLLSLWLPSLLILLYLIVITIVYPLFKPILLRAIFAMSNPTIATAIIANVNFGWITVAINIIILHYSVQLFLVYLILDYANWTGVVIAISLLYLNVILQFLLIFIHLFFILLFINPLQSIHY